MNQLARPARFIFLVQWAAIAVLYVVGAKLGFALAFDTKQVTAVWPPAGIALASLILIGPHAWPGVFIGAFVSNAISNEPMITAAGIAAGNTAGPAVAALLLRNQFRLRADLSRLRDVLALTVFGAGLAMFITATNGALNLALAGLIEWRDVISVWSLWWIGDAMAALLIAPLALTWWSSAASSWTLANAAEFALCNASIFLVAALSFSQDLPLAYPIFPVVVWMALRFAQKHTALAVNAVSAIAIWQTVGGAGPFVYGTLDFRLSLLVTFMAVLSVTMLSLGAVAEERRNAEDRLRRTNLELEERILDRTAELARTNAGLRESEERFRGAFESASHGMALISVDGRWLRVNSAVCEIVGYSEQELLCSDFQTITHPDDLELDLDHVRSLLTGASDSYHMEKRYLHKNGSIVSILLSVSIVRDGDGQPLHFVSQIIDITRQVQAKTELIEARVAAEKASSAKTQFLANMSHEIRTPMNGVIGFAELLLDSKLSSEQAMNVTRLRDAAEALLIIIDDVLDLSRVEAGKLQFERVEFSIRNMVSASLDLVRMQAAQKGLEISLEFDPALPDLIEGDPKRLRQVLINLLSNAVKYTSRGRVSVVVGLGSRDFSGKCLVEVADTGIGIPKEQQHLLFQNFCRLPGTEKLQVGGTGLGLAISKRLVDGMQGSIGMRCAEGGGSVFWFALPLVPCESLSASPSNVSALATGALRVLVAEDIEMNQIIIEATLKAQGHAAVVVPNGAAALDRLREESFDLVLMDVQMPVLDGIAATKRIREGGGSFANIPIIALTANAMADEVFRCKAAGMTGHLAKPINRHQLAGILADVARSARPIEEDHAWPH